jgi:cephalosporin-C deacetylase
VAVPGSQRRSFWSKTLQELSLQPLRPSLTKFDLPFSGAEGFSVRFDGFSGTRLAGHLLLPGKRQGKVPGVLQFHGYLSCKSEPLAHKPFLDLGMAVLAVDARGQAGESGDKTYPGDFVEGWMTRGIQGPEGSYLQALYADTVQAMNFLLSRPEVDASRILANGDSQGGGLALITACLDPRVALVGADNPSLMAFPLKLDLKAEGSTVEIRKYLELHPERREQVLHSLEHFDLVNLLPDLKCPSFWSASDDDPICPLASVRAGFDQAACGDKQFRVYHGMGHGVHGDQLGLKLEWIKKRFFGAGN